MHLRDFAPLPRLQASQHSWTDTLLQKVSQLAEDTPMMFDAAIQQTLSFEAMYYNSAAWRNRKAAIESKQQLMVGIALRLNTLIEVTSKRR